MPSAIEWTDETWNPVTGCTRVSPGCDHCYMFAMYPRLTAMGVRGYELDPQQVQLLPERLDAPLRWGKPAGSLLTACPTCSIRRCRSILSQRFLMLCAPQPYSAGTYSKSYETAGESRCLVGSQPGPLWWRVAGRRLDRHFG